MSLYLNKPTRAASTGLTGPVLTARLALTPETRRDAYRLRYQSYLAAGHIEPNHSETFSDVYDELPNTKTIVLYYDDMPAASVRTCTFASGTDERSPAVDVYREEINQILKGTTETGYGQRGIETTRLVRSPNFENNQSLVFLLYRMAGYVGMMAHTQRLFACVRTNHVSFYKRLGYQPAAEARPYPGLSCPMQLMSCTRDRYDEVRMAYPVIDPYTTATGNLDHFLDGAAVSLTVLPR
ncbi:hypothetical protein NFI95_06410 [Acetobacteraceae bacterium KSS8]|uniref:N-acyl amino acid synthase FeeM catalytic core domain-containing protein n=1 Tax=Endosaccharibacter trunci TaxID=2812733 RepID=A0ABT1W5Q6_9PROT|nr:hypothetical protein [Acetobacteraceae bacterium KSS8]